MATNHRVSRRRSRRSPATLHELYEQAAAIGQELMGLGGLLRDAAQDKIADIRDSSSAVVASVRDQGQGKLRHWANEVEGYIRNQPLKSMLLAATFGLLCGKLAKRR